jgi:nucleoside-diphosphate-sugar epimerase
MARILVTGATGFVGRAAVRRLRADGHEVTAPRLDLLAAGEDEIARLVAAEQATHCLHAAWYTNHADYLVAEVNRDWAAASLRLAAGFRAGGGRRLVGLGTCLEYDQHAPPGPFSERATPLRPDTLYARSKVETFERLAERGGGFAWARLFYIYGPGDRAGRLVPYIVDTLARGEAAGPRYGGLRRDYVHVDDLAGQLARIVAGGIEGAVNTGTGAAVSLSEMFETAGALLERPDLVQANDALPDSERPSIEADMGRFRAAIGAPEARSLRDGLAGLIGARG